MMYLKGWNLFSMKPPFMILLLFNIGITLHTAKAQFDPLVSSDCQSIQFDSTILSSAEESALITFGTCTYDVTNSTIGAFFNLTDCGDGLTVANNELNTTYTGTFLLTVFNNTDLLPFQSNYEFECTYDRLSDNFTVGFNSSVRLTGYAYANSTVSFANHFTLTIPKTLYNMGDYIDLNIAFSPSSPNLRMMPQHCYARPVDNLYKYDLLLDRCPSDPTTTIRYTGTLEADVRFEAFRFLESTGSELYVTCEILVCLGDEARCDNCTDAISRKRRDIRTDSRDLTFIHSNTFYVKQKRQVKILRGDKIESSSHTAHAHQQLNFESLNELICAATLFTLLFLLIIATIKKLYDYQEIERKQIQPRGIVKKVLPLGSV